MVPTAEALAIDGVQRCPAIAALDDMVREHAMLRRGAVAPLSTLDRLAPKAGFPQHGITPLTMRGGKQFSVSALRRRLDRARVHHAQANMHDLEFSHLARDQIVGKAYALALTR